MSDTKERKGGADPGHALWNDRAGRKGVVKKMGSVMLVAAVMVSLALGVLVAYGVCYGMFQVFRIHSQAVARERMQAGMSTVAGVLAER